MHMDMCILSRAYDMYTWHVHGTTRRYDPRKLRPVVAKYHDPELVDPVGPSPVVIHKAQLRSLVDPWCDARDAHSLSGMRIACE